MFDDRNRAAASAWDSLVTSADAGATAGASAGAITVATGSFSPAPVAAEAVVAPNRAQVTAAVATTAVRTRAVRTRAERTRPERMAACLSRGTGVHRGVIVCFQRVA
ncbi:hypothetical protein Acsp05_04820 [Actinokineospora sp. NBRC 105648]|nr:hypothetical protein Acsp05_04820 [Actinokineospora sp. NBRC 105648]